VRAWNAPAWREHPPRKSPVVDPDGPAVALAQVGEGKLRVYGSCQGFTSAHRRAKPRNRRISRKNQVIAIIDRQAELRIVIGPATPAGLRGSFGDPHLQSRFDQPDRRGKSSEACSDNRRPREAQPVTSSRATVAITAGLLTRTRVRGGAQPVLSIRLSSFE